MLLLCYTYSIFTSMYLYMYDTGQGEVKVQPN